MAEIKAEYCPLCSQSNQCSMAQAGGSDIAANAEACWCQSVTFPAELLNDVPDLAQGKTCVCQRCLQTYHST